MKESDAHGTLPILFGLLIVFINFIDNALGAIFNILFFLLFIVVLTYIFNYKEPNFSSSTFISYSYKTYTEIFWTVFISLLLTAIPLGIGANYLSLDINQSFLFYIIWVILFLLLLPLSNQSAKTAYTWDKQASINNLTNTLKLYYADAEHIELTQQVGIRISYPQEYEERYMQLSKSQASSNLNSSKVLELRLRELLFSYPLQLMEKFELIDNLIIVIPKKKGEILLTLKRKEFLNLYFSAGKSIYNIDYKFYSNLFISQKL